MNMIGQIDETQLLADAAQALRQTTGLTLQTLQTQPGKPGNHADYLLKLCDATNPFHHFVTECKHTVDRTSALTRIRGKLLELSDLGAPLLVTHHLSPALAQECRKLDLNFVDTAGNAYINVDSTLVFVSGNRPKVDAPPQRLGISTNAAGLRIVFAILAQPGLLGATYRDLSGLARVSMGSIGPVLRDMQHRGLLSGLDSQGKRHILDLARLQDDWATHYPIRLRPTLKPWNFSAENADWWQRETSPSDFLWSGEVAESLTTGNLRPSTQTLYVRPGHTRSEVLRRLMAKHRMRRQPDGAIEVLDSFWNFDARAQRSDLVPDHLIFADLIGLADSRTAEAAATFRSWFLNAAGNT